MFKQNFKAAMGIVLGFYAGSCIVDFINGVIKGYKKSAEEDAKEMFEADGK